MTDVTFVTSLQGRQAERVKDISSGLMEKRPELKVEVFEAEETSWPSSSSSTAPA